MLQKSLPFFIDYLLLKKDEEIYDNFLQVHDIFIKYCNNEINKEYLLNEHSHRNKLFLEWCEIYKYQNLFEINI
jgi:hypothetical protein